VTDRSEQLHAAVAAGVLGSEREHARLLQSVVEVARAIFGAAAASVMLLDEATDELVFEAVAGAGEEKLVGLRLPSSTGIAGWVLVTRQPLVVDDLATDPRFAHDVAEKTGYVPQGLMAAPLLDGDTSLGVLQVLDRQSRFTLEEMDLLGLFSNQAAIALGLLQRARKARRTLEGVPEDAALARLAEKLEAAAPGRREAVERLLAALEEIVGRK